MLFDPAFTSSYVVAFVMGVASSLHCVSMCGYSLQRWPALGGRQVRVAQMRDIFRQNTNSARWLISMNR